MTYEALIDKQSDIDDYVEEAKKVLNMYTVKMQDDSKNLKSDEIAIFAATMAFTYRSLNLTAEMMKKLWSMYKDVIDIKENVNQIEDELWKLDLKKEES